MGSKSLKVYLINKEFFQWNIRRCIISPVKAIIYNYRFGDNMRIIPSVHYKWFICSICVIWEKEINGIRCLPCQCPCIGIDKKLMLIEIPPICGIVITAHLITVELPCPYPMDKGMPDKFCAVLQFYNI